MEYISNTLGNLVEQTAFMNLTFGNLIMIAVACVFLYLAIRTNLSHCFLFQLPLVCCL